MKCPTCKSLMEIGSTELIFKRERSVIVVEDVPALVCKQCGEATVELKSSKMSHDIADREIKRGVALEFAKFKNS